jgi:ADP-ribose pyrophosphatase YjhB (NUDIX family)
MKVRAAGLLVHDGAVLLVEHRKGDRSYWLLPGGGVHLGERLKDSLKREFQEELTIRVEPGDLVFVAETSSPEGEHILQPVFSVTDVSISEMRLGTDERVAGFRFFTPEKLDEVVIYPNTKDELRQYLASGRVNCRYVLKQWLD